MGGLPQHLPRWGSEYKKALGKYFDYSMFLMGHGTSLPVDDNSISLDENVKDAWGLPAMRVTYKDHPDDLKFANFLQARSLEILDAAGAQDKWSYPITAQEFGVHLLGTCRRGNDAKSSVINRDHRTHDVPNLFLCDGSSFVTSGRGQPTETITAVAFRAADRISTLVKQGEV
jgi:choline dehydrogenase-like flavoprotein